MNILAAADDDGCCSSAEREVSPASGEWNAKAEALRRAEQPAAEGVERPTETQKEGSCFYFINLNIWDRLWFWSLNLSWQVLEDELTLKKKEQEAFFRLSISMNYPNPSSPTKLSKFVPFPDAGNT